MAVLAYSQDNTTQQARLYSSHGTAEAEYHTYTPSQPIHGLTISLARVLMSSKGPDSLWAAMSIY
jgi:hypothetical protein